MKLVMICWFCQAWFGSVSALGLGRRMERAGCFTAMLVDPAKLCVMSGFIKFERTTEISLKTLWKWKQTNKQKPFMNKWVIKNKKNRPLVGQGQSCPTPAHPVFYIQEDAEAQHLRRHPIKVTKAMAPQPPDKKLKPFWKVAAWWQMGKQDRQKAPLCLWPLTAIFKVFKLMTALKQSENRN